MKESYVEGLASHDGPESCVGIREGVGEALTGVQAGRVSSREKFIVRGADAVEKSGRQHGVVCYGERHLGPAWSETPRTSGCHLHGNREISWLAAGSLAVRIGKASAAIR